MKQDEQDRIGWLYFLAWVMVYGGGLTYAIWDNMTLLQGWLLDW
jgi:hypothetical protein